MELIHIICQDEWHSDLDFNGLRDEPLKAK